MKNTTKNISFSFGKYGIIILFSIIGLAIIIISDYPFKKPAHWWAYCGKSVCNSIGCTIISAALISLLLEISSIKEMVSHSIKTLLMGEVILEKYTDTELDKLKQDIFKKQTNIDSSQNINDTIFRFEKQLVNIATEPYYEYHISNTILTPISLYNIFLKRIEVEYKLINKTGQPYSGEFEWKIFSPKENLSNEDIQKNYVFLELIVCGKKIDEIPPIHVKSVSKNQYNLYDYIVSMKLPEYNCQEYTLKCILEYNIPYFDVTHVYNMRKPCKTFRHSMHIKPDKDKKDNWEISGDAFTAFYRKKDSSSVTDDYIVEQPTSSTVNINFKNWTLPGSGYVILAKKSN